MQQHIKKVNEKNKLVPATLPEDIKRLIYSKHGKWEAFFMGYQWYNEFELACQGKLSEGHPAQELLLYPNEEVRRILLLLAKVRSGVALRYPGSYKPSLFRIPQIIFEGR